jgi:CrcB protein
MVLICPDGLGIVAVAVGGALGSVARYLVAVGSGKMFGTNFPWQAAHIFLTVGICGGSTTFSTFSLDSYYLIERGQLGVALAYISALVGGLYLGRL